MKEEKPDKNMLKKMRKLVASTHWIKRSYYQILKKDGEEKACYCLVGMINYVVYGSGGPYTGARIGGTHLLSEPGSSIYDDSVSNKAKVLGRAIFAEILRRHPSSRTIRVIEDWNDRPSTKREDVLEVLDALIAK